MHALELLQVGTPNIYRLWGSRSIAPGHMTAAELSDAFVVRRVEAREEHELLRQANQAPTNADIKLLFAQTDRRFEVLQQQAMAYSMRVESDLAVLMDSMGRELRQ